MSESFDEFQPAPNEWDEFQPANPGPSTRDVLKAVSSIDPAQASKASKLAKKYNAADEVLLRTLQDAEMVDRINTATTKLDKAPVLADYMRNSPFVAAQAQKDIDPLVKMNEQMRAPRTALGTLGDVGVTALKGVVGLPQSLVGLVDIPTLGGFGKDLETLGVRFKDTQNFLSSLYSPAQQQANQAVSEADGFVGTLGAMLQNPSTIATTVGQSAPQMLGGAAIGRGLVAVAPRVAPWLSAALGEGIISAGGAAEQTREQTDDGRLSVKQSLSAVASGGGTALFGAVGGKVSQRLGLADIDTALVARGVDKTSAQAAKTGFIAAVTKAGVSEGVFEELPQSVQEQMWQNYANDRPINEGVGAAAAQGLLAGLSMGSGFQVLAEGGQRIAERAQQADAAAQDAAKLQNLMASAAEATLRQNNPETFAQLVQHMADNTEGAPKSVYIDAQVFNQAVQTFTPEQLAQAFPSVTPEQIAEAVTTNRTVEVPIGEALAAVPGTPLEQVFLQNARSAPNALSLADAQTQGEQAAEWIKTEAERVLQQAQDQAAWQTSSDAVRTTILDQLNQAGRFTPEVNEAYATLQMHFFSTMAALTGVTPQEMYDRFSLKVAAGSQQAGAGNLEQGPGLFDLTVPGDGNALREIKTDGTTIVLNAKGRYFNPEGVIEVASVRTPAKARGNGKARRALETLIKQADAEGVTLKLDASPLDKKTNLGKLVAFYESLGFERTGRSNNAAGEPEMIRRPQALNQSATSLPPTIEVDGKTRPTTNSNGQPIAATEEGVRNFWAWFGDSKAVDAAGKPLVVYHGSPTPEGITEFSPGGKQGSRLSGDAYGVASYFTSSPGEASIYARDDGAVLPVYVRGEILDVDSKLSEVQSDRVSQLASEVMLPSDKARFAIGREVRSFYDVQDARDFFDAQRKNWEAFGDGMDRAKPEARADGGEYQVEFTNFDADVRIETGEDAFTLFKAIGFDNIAAAGFDGLMFARDGGAKWVVMQRPETNVKSAIGNSGEFDPANPNILMQSVGSAQVDELTGLPLNPDGTVTVYHHTSADKAAQISKTGKLKSAAEPDVYVTTRKETDTGYGDTAVAIRVNPELLQIDDEFPDGRVDYRIDTGKPGGSIAVKVGEFLNQSLQDGAVALRSLANEGNDQAILAQALVDRLGLGAQELADVLEGVASLSESDRLGGVPSLTPVLAEMRRAVLDDPKVLDAVIGSVPVDVVDNLAGSQAAAKVLLNNEAVLEDSLAFNAELPVAGGLGDAANTVGLLVREAAVRAAELARVTLGSGRETQEGRAAMGAGQGNGLGQDGSFQQKARATFNPQTLLISLNENANLSSFLHESGHFFLEVMADLASQPNAPAQVREDMDKLLAWFGIKGDETVGGPDAGGELGQFAGKKAKGADLVALESAQQRIAGGEDAEQVRRATGWFQGADGKWRFEISDDRAHFVKTPKLKEYLTKKFTKGEKLSKADKEALDAARAEFETANDAMFAITDRKSPEFDAAFEKRAEVQAKVYALEKRARGDFTKLGDILVHDTLFAAYPDLKDVGISLSVDPTMENTAEGAFDTRQNRVVLSAKTEQALLENLFHEIQHAIQTREGYARGGSPESDGGLAGYRRLAGEVEARNTAARSGLTPEQRRETAPGATSDTPANEVTVVFAQDGNLPTDNTRPVRRTPLETWRAMTLDQKRQYHEKFAESFEAYLLEGKAPSAELQPLFRRFRSWLVNVYKSLKDFMRGRDLNMNDEVRQVFDRMLATDEQIRQAEEAAGMLPDFDATNEAIEKLQARSLRDLKWTVGARSKALKALQKEAANLRKAVEAEVRAEVDDMPVYQAQAAIDRIKGEPSTEQLETIAEATGFTSASEMLTAIGKADTKAAMIEGMTDQRMLENFGELATPQAIEEAANDAVHNEARARALATELKGQADALNPRQQTGTDRNGRPVTVNALVAAAKQFAENITARRKVKDLKKAAAQHRAAEARAGKAWQEATAKGKTQEAVQAKRDQLLNNYAAKSMQEADAEITKVIDYFKKFDKDTIRKNIPSSYLDQIDALLENMDLRKSVSRTELERRASLRKWVESQQAIGLDPIVPDELMENAQRVSYKEMTVDELRSMRDVIKNIEHLGRLKSKLLAAKDKREFDAAVDAWAKEIRDNGGKPLPVKLEGDSRPVKMFKSAWADHRKLNSLIRQFAANADNSEGFKLLIRSMNERGTQEDVMIEKASVRLAEIHAPIEKLPGGFSGAKLFIPEINNSLTRAGRLAVALNWGNEQNRQRVRDGDNWTNEQVDAILRTLTPVELKFVNDVWEYLDSYWPEIKAKQERVSGVVEDKVQADPFTVTLADGTEVQMRGGYYPIKYDGDRSLKSQKQEAEQIAKDMLRGAMLRPATRRGHTKARVDEVIGRPVKKDLSVITQHVTQVVHDLAWHEWAIDANRLMNDPRIASAIRDYYGAETHRAMTDAIEAIVVGDVAKQTSIDQLLLMMRANVTRSIMGASLTTALLQPFGLTQSMARIGVTPVLKGAGRWAGDALRMESTVKWVGEKSDFMRLRSKTFNRELREISQRVRGKSKIAQVADASLFMLMQKMQLVADIPTWVGAYEKALNSGAEEATAVQLADEAVLSSQGGGNTRDLAAVQRDHPFLTQFYSYFNTTLQLVTESTAATDFKNPRAVAGWLGDMMLLAVVPAILPALITFSLKGGGEDDEPEEWAKRLVEWQAGYMLGMFVGLRELPALWSPFDYGGPPAAKLINDGRRLVQQANQGEIDEPAVLATIGFLGTALGIPTTQIVRSYKGWKAWDEGDAPASSILFGPPPKD